MTKTVAPPTNDISASPPKPSPLYVTANSNPLPNRTRESESESVESSTASSSEDGPAGQPKRRSNARLSKPKAPIPADVPPTLLEKDEKFNLTLYKTELCRAFEEGRPCKFGDGCLFAHGRDQLRNVPRHPKYKTEICRVYHSGGTCPYGVRCRFIHDFTEARTNWASAWQKWQEQLEALQAEIASADAQSNPPSRSRTSSVEDHLPGMGTGELNQFSKSHSRAASREDHRLSVFASLLGKEETSTMDN